MIIDGYLYEVEDVDVRSRALAFIVAMLITVAVLMWFIWWPLGSDEQPPKVNHEGFDFSDSRLVLDLFGGERMVQDPHSGGWIFEDQSGEVVATFIPGGQ